MTEIAVGCGQLTWNQFPNSDGARWPEAQVLAEIATAGYDGAPANPLDGLSTPESAALYAELGLRPAPGYLGADWWDPAQRAAILDQAQRQAAFSRELGVRELYVAAGGSGYVARSGRTRAQAAGHVTPDDALSDAEYGQFAETLNAAAELTLREDVTCCFHNHVGTPIETRAETDRLIALLDPALVALGPDTGHLAWAGADPVAFCRDYAPRIRTLHLKDIDESVASRGRAAAWDYRTFTANGVFTELGQGGVDFLAILAILREHDFTGWAIVETDVTQRPTALDSAEISRVYLRTLGL